jgi:tetraacyldisaccharide 4'-kinase
LQIKRKFPDTVVVVCEKRAEGIRRLRQEHPEVDLVVMDDGFQHRYVEPKVNIVMIDATRPVQHDRMLPAGNLRDLPEQLHRAHYFIVTKSDRPAHSAQGSGSGRLSACLLYPFRKFPASAALP